MKKVNDSSNSPLHFVMPDGKIIGQFYNSIDRTYHLAEYVPYNRPPHEYLCEKVGNFSPSRAEGTQRTRPCCPSCADALKTRSGLSDSEFKKYGFV